MHTALRLGVAVAERARAVNPTCHIAFYGLYATLNAEYLLSRVADSVLGGEADEALVELARNLERARDDAGGRGQAPGECRSEQRGLPPAPRPILAKLDFPLPSRTQLPSLKKYPHVDQDGRPQRPGAAFVNSPTSAAPSSSPPPSRSPTRCWPPSPRATRAPISSRRFARCAPPGPRCVRRGCRSRRGRRSTTTVSSSTSSRPTS